MFYFKPSTPIQTLDLNSLNPKPLIKTKTYDTLIVVGYSNYFNHIYKFDDKP